MSECTYNAKIGKYHDGELPLDGAVELERHLATCDACMAELARLRKLSAELLSLPAPTLASAAMERLHEHVGALTDQSLRHFAELLSGLAAAVLVMASAWLLRSTDVSAEPLPPWENAAQTLETRDGAQPPALHTARWIVTELQSKKTNE